MKPFRFSLQPLRVLRQRKEQTAQQTYAAALAAVDDAATKLFEASAELASGWNALCDELARGVSASKLIRTRAWCTVLEIRQHEREAALNEARRATNDAWQTMMLATRDRESLDRFHDKCRRAHDLEVQRDTQKTMDELAVRRAGPGASFRFRHIAAAR